MAEKIKQSELKKKQIVEAALKLFFEKGIVHIIPKCNSFYTKN